MKSKKWRLAGMLLFMVAGLRADLPLKPIHPDETVEQTLTQRFSLENAITVIGTMQQWLESFRRLTVAAKGKIGAAAWKEIGNTEWDVQTLGFANQPRAVEGALRYQNWLLKKTQYQLALLELERGKTSPQKTGQARQEMEQAEKEFQAFWDSLSIAD